MFVCQGKKVEIDVPFSLAMGLRVCTHCVRTVRHCVILYQGYNAPNIKKYISSSYSVWIFGPITIIEKLSLLDPQTRDLPVRRATRHNIKRNAPQLCARFNWLLVTEKSAIHTNENTCSDIWYKQVITKMDWKLSFTCMGTTVGTPLAESRRSMIEFWQVGKDTNIDSFFFHISFSKEDKNSRNCW